MNACEWEGAGAATGPGELAAALCAACCELQRGKATRKFPRPLWDYGNYFFTILDFYLVSFNLFILLQCIDKEGGFNAISIVSQPTFETQTPKRL